MTMDKQSVLDLIGHNLCEVIPSLQEHRLSSGDSLADLGANSIDRSEILVLTLAALNLRVPLVEMSGARTIGELAELIHARI